MSFVNDSEDNDRSLDTNDSSTVETIMANKKNEFIVALITCDWIVVSDMITVEFVEEVAK